MSTDNISQQADELEVLKSIYENEWTEDDWGGSYTMKISKTVKLFITLHPDYPSYKPPTYQLMAQELTKDERNRLQMEFQTIYENNMGGPILYQWIEKLKEYTIYKSKNNNKMKQLTKQIIKMNNKLRNNIQRFCEEVVHGPTIEDRKSTFQGHVCSVSSETDVRGFLEYLMENKKIALATHNIYAYRIAKKSTILQDCEDDGEKHASKRLLHLLQKRNLENVMVVVSRWRGGTLLGADRFKDIIIYYYIYPLVIFVQNFTLLYYLYITLKM